MRALPLVRSALPRRALSTATESVPWYRRPLSAADSAGSWQLACTVWGFIIFVGLPWSYNRVMALTAPDPTSRVRRHKVRRSSDDLQYTLIRSS